MPNVASVLKDEITRLARKEIKIQTESLRKASAAYRKDIATLKRRISSLERELEQYRRTAPEIKASRPEEVDATSLRFSANGLRASRKRLGLSQADYAALVGVSVASVTRWERGAARPRQPQLAAIAKVRSMGKREALDRLNQLKA